MCLEPEFFEDESRRNFMRDLEGVTPDEAKGALTTINTTIYPVAVEMARWINNNWSQQEIKIKLGDEHLVLFERALQR